MPKGPLGSKPTSVESFIAAVLGFYRGEYKPRPPALGLTPFEAGEKWCPFVRQTWAQATRDGRMATNSHPSFNMYRVSFGNAEHRCPCISSECMAWRWTGGGRGSCGLAGPEGAPAPIGGAA